MLLVAKRRGMQQVLQEVPQQPSLRHWRGFGWPLCLAAREPGAPQATALPTPVRVSVTV